MPTHADIEMTDIETSSQIRMEKRLRVVEQKIDTVFGLLLMAFALAVMFFGQYLVMTEHFKWPWDMVALAAASGVGLVIFYASRNSYPKSHDEDDQHV